MKMQHDLFPGYSSHHFTTADGITIFARVSPQKDLHPLLLVHGYPQTHHEFHQIAPWLSPHYTLILVDLRGYGQSSVAPDSTNGSAYTKRLMGQDCLSVMQQLGYSGPGRRFTILGHDRGARVAYRLALDMPDTLDKVIVVDILPTASMFRGFGDTPAGLRAYHWLFLAQPEPFPETMIGGVDNGKFYLEHTLSSWTKARTLQDYSVEALDAYRAAYCKAERIHSTCEDYRAAAHFDRLHDEDDLQQGKKIAIPLLAAWGNQGLFAEAMNGKQSNPLAEWQRYALLVTGKSFDCGHFITEEKPQDLAEAVLTFCSDSRI